MPNDYELFLTSKSSIASNDGFKAIWMPSFLKDFQSEMTDWALWKGRAALLEDCGLGKTVQELVWAENVVRHTNRPVVSFGPLAVARQTAREAAKFGIEVNISLDGKVKPGINIANYERIHLFDPDDFAGAVCDESGILKSFDGVRRSQITEFMKKMRYRLLATATAAPNEYIELGTHSEALGYLGYVDMLTRFFKNNQGNSIKPMMVRHHGRDFAKMEAEAKWRFKGHAEQPFWRWVCSWARALRKPSDLGFDDTGFILPKLTERQHLVETRTKPDGMLFALPAFGLSEQREERRRTLAERCEMAAELVRHGKPATVWCHLNDEGNLLESLIPDCVQISGNDSEEQKEEKFLAFIDGQARVMVTKGKIGAWGLNLQHCAHSVSFPTHSFEEYYQSIRRFYRFGQKNEVVSDIVTTEGEKSVLENLQRKAKAADRMFADLTAHMRDALDIDKNVVYDLPVEVPAWL